MDDVSFDRLARLAGDPVTRRKALRGGFGGILAAIGVRAAAAEVAPEGCRGQNDACSAIKGCCRGLQCQGGVCKYPQGCGKKNDYCKKDGNCCNGFYCDINNAKCIRACGKKGDFCNANSDCCNQFTCDKKHKKCKSKS
ncbi:MAG TPA: hypothetical protein VFQ80_14700 [Thermomicrobiales bacterium]|nr:hypothetical protein [Thermomicrobiales bacterium]